MAELAELPEKNSIVGHFTQIMLDSVAILKLQPFISCFFVKVCTKTNGGHCCGSHRNQNYNFSTKCVSGLR